MDSTASNLLSARPAPRLAGALRARAGEIARRLDGGFGAADQLPALLSRLGVALDGSGLAGVTPRHSYLDDSLLDWSRLRRIIFEEAAAHLARPLDGGEVAALNLAVDAALRDAVAALLETQDRDQRAVAQRHARYVSTLAHDLRGGFNGAVRMIEVLKRDLARDEKFAAAAEDLGMMRSSIMDAVGIMERFLGGERIRAPGAQVKPVVIDLPALVAELAAQGAYAAGNKGVRIVADVAPGSVTADRQLLMLVLQNFLSNAVKHGRAGTVRITSPGPGPERSRTISVIDEGPGIPAPQLAAIFQPPPLYVEGPAALGLGLSICAQAAELMGAKLEAKSVLGAGATFSITLK